MNTSILKQIKRCFTIYTALFITLITSRVRAVHNCGHEQLVQCAKPLSIITESGLTFVSSKTDLEKICPDLKEALKCIHSYTRMCMNMHHRKHFKQLFHGTSAMVHELCDNSTYQEEYLKYVPCMKQVADENEVCFSQYSRAMKDIQSKPTPSTTLTMSESQSQPRHTGGVGDMDLEYQKKKKRELADEGIKNVCCTFQEYVQCSTHTTRRACGEEAAEFSRNFLDRMSSSMIQMHCSEYGTRQCGLASGGGGGMSSQTWWTSIAVAVFTSLRYLASIS